MQPKIREQILGEGSKIAVIVGITGCATSLNFRLPSTAQWLETMLPNGTLLLLADVEPDKQKEQHSQTN